MTDLAAAVEAARPASGQQLERGPDDEPIPFVLAGLSVTLSGLTRTARTLVASRFEGWSPRAEFVPTHTLSIVLSWLPPSFRIPELGREEEYRLLDRTVLLGRGSVAVGLGSPRIEVAVSSDPVMIGQEIENVLRLAVAHHLLGSGGLLLHAGAVTLGSGALVFPAASGTGKTTLVRDLSAAGFSPLGDDMTAVLPGPNGWTVRPLPFTGERSLMGDSRPRRLVAVHPIQRGPGPRLAPLSGAHAVAALANQTLGLALYPDLSSLGLETASRITATVPIERLFRSLGDDAASLLRERHGDAV